jgi:hypothetical protein
LARVEERDFSAKGEVIGWIAEAVANGRHIVDEHYYKRCRQ